MDKIKQLISQKSFSYILLSVVTAIQILYIGYNFVYEKEGYHCDEVYSYGLSNGFYMPFIECTRNDVKIDELDEFINLNEWKSGEMFHNYLTVQPDQRFRYDSVWYNQSQDRNPPLYYATLHTICSFFPDTFSNWFGFSLNLVCFVIMQIFLYKLAKKVLKSRYLAVLICLFFGFTAGAVNMVLFVRMYCMLTMWGVIFMYLHSKLYATKETPLLKQMIPMTVVTALGALTAHLFLFVAFVTAVIFCIRYLITKRFKVLFAYAGSMLSGVLLSFLVFPPSVKQLFGETGENSSSLFFRQIKIIPNYFFSDISGIYPNQLVIFTGAFIIILLILVVLSLPIQFLFRESPRLKNFYKNILSGLKDFFNALKSPKKLISALGNIKNCSPMVFVMVMCTLFLSVVVSYRMNFLEVGFVDRYLFILYPFVVLCIGGIVLFVFSKFRYKKAVTSFILTLCTATTFFGTSSAYLFKKDCTLDEIEELTAGAQVIIMKPEKVLMRTHIIMDIELQKVDKFMLTYYEMAEQLTDEFEKADKNKPIYMILGEIKDYDENGKAIFQDSEGYKITEEEFFGQFERLEVTNQKTLAGTYTMMDDNYLVYRLA